MLKTKIISSMEKCFLDSSFEEFAEVKRINIYKNIDGAFQVIPFNDEEAEIARQNYKVKAQGDIAEHIRFRLVENIPNYLPLPMTPKLAAEMDGGYLRTAPGLYPDVLTPIMHKNWFSVVNCQLRALWVDVLNDGSICPGEHKVQIQFCDLEDNVVTENEIVVNVINAQLPPQKTKVTQWFYPDCIADYYDIPMWSERHWAICKDFLDLAVYNGINMMLIPVFTPPLDTAVGGERTTCQLVGVKVENGCYSFDFSLLERYIDLCIQCKIQYFEISHLFTQWGAYHAPKVMATVDGEYKRIFGWDTDAAGEEYVSFLNVFLKALTEWIDARGYTDRVYFHLSDEPRDEHLEQYKTNKDNVAKVLEGRKILDALSNVDYYKQGLCQIPVPRSDTIESFLPEDVKERWIYYCGRPSVGFSNRLMAMHSARTRFMGVQMYKYGMEGFLHWGYNFYNNQYSDDHIDPFLNGNGGFWVGGGDTVSVYPWKSGQPLESLRIIAFRQGLEDMRALELCQQYYPKEEIVAVLEKIYGGSIVFDKCVNDTETMQKMRDAIDAMIIAKLS